MTLKDLLYELVCLGFVPNLMSENGEPPLVFHATRQGVGFTSTSTCKPRTRGL